MSSAAKDTIYIDIDDEITSIIEKVRGAEHKVVALVLPKRCAVLQSIVNMKLLKRTGDDAKKHIVLITSEAGLLPLAGAVGLHVAKTLQSKPAIPPAPHISSGIVAVDDDTPEEPEIDASKPIGVLAGGPEPEETIEVDNTDLDDVKETAALTKKSAAKKFKIPNFNKFRLRFVLGGAALIAVLVLWYIAAFVMPKATITLKTDTQSVTSDINFKTSPDVTEVNLEEKIIPSTVQELQKTEVEKVAATGTKDAGTKATGTITIRNCDYSEGFTIAAGSTFTGGGKNFISTESVTVPKFTGPSSSCTLSGSSSGKATVNVRAPENGESYNVDAQSYSVPGIPSSSKVDAVGSAMTGGTSKTVKVVSQQDIDGANQRIQERIGTDVNEELAEELREAGYFPITETLITNTPTLASDPKLNEEATEATVTATFIYTMIGVKEDDLKKLVEDSVKDEIDTNKQAIQDYGLDEAVFRVSDKKANGESTAFFQTIAVAGTQLDIEALKQQIAGKKRGETQNLLQDLPGVQDVSVDYSPFWVYSTPKKTAKIQIILEEANPTDATESE